MSKIIKLSLVLLVLISFVMSGFAQCIAAPTQGRENLKIIRYQVEDFFIPQVSGMADYRLEHKINRELWGIISYWNDPSHYTALWGNFEVSFYNSNLLGIHFRGMNYSRRAAHPNKIDRGIYIDLKTGMVYELDDLFIADIDYESRIKELCRTNQGAYRLTIQGLWDGWTYETFAQSWTKVNETFLFSDKSMRVYAMPAHATGYISGYSIPYSDLMDIIDKDGALWKALQSHEPMPINVELEELDIDDFILRDFDVKPGDMESWVVVRLGEPKSKTQVQDGLSYDYGDIEIIIDSKNKVVNILTDNKKVTTRRWVHPGHSIKTVKERYGENAVVSSFGEYDFYEYSYPLGAETYILRFAVKKGTDRVSYIGWRISES